MSMIDFEYPPDFDPGDFNCRCMTIPLGDKYISLFEPGLLSIKDDLELSEYYVSTEGELC